MFRSSILAAALLLCLTLDAQMMPFKNYGIKDGLSDNNVQAVIRDNRGLLWVGTDFGIYWFDGKKFYPPDIKANIGQLYITGFYEDRTGTMWILTFFNGIYKYQNGRFTNYMVDAFLKEGSTNSVSDMIQVAPDKYLVINQNRPYLFDGKSFSPLDSGNAIIKTGTNSITQMADQTIVLGTDDGFFLYRFVNGKLVPGKHLLHGFRTAKVLATKDQLCALTDKGVMCYPFTGPRTFLAQPKAYFINKPLKDVAVGRDGALWAVGDNGSFWDLADTVFKIKNGKIISYTKKNGLPENVQQIYFDDEGITWFANRKGLCMLGDEYYEFNRVVNGPYNNPVTSLIVDDKKNLWAGSISGLALRKENRFNFFINAGKTPIGYVAWLSKTKKGLFLAGTVGGVLKIEPNKIGKYLNLHSTAFSEADDGCLWFGGINGEIWRYDRNVLTQLTIARPVNEMITALYADGQQLWVGYREKGIVKYKISNGSLLPLNEFSAATGYPGMRIRCCTSDKMGNIFWGTRTNGVFIFSQESGLLRWHINTQNGLNANWIKDAMCDNDGTLYLATNNGINIVSGNYKNPLVRHIKINDDNINRETNCILKNGDIFYVGTNEGVLKWMPGNIRKDTVPPSVYFTKISIQGLKKFAIDPYTANGGIISLPYDQHFVAFEFAGISLKNPENVLYHYILSGQDNDWSPVTEHNDVAFDLKPGNYIFKVAAKNADGIWSRRPAVFHFIINPPFWQTWWFIILLAAVILFAAYSAYRYKLSKMLALELLRNKISTDLHDDIGSTLSSISILSEVAAREKEQRSKRILAEISERSYVLMEKMDDIVWSISSRNDTVGNLFIRVQQFASTVLEAKDIEYEVHIPEKVKLMKLDMQHRQHIYLILKEVINNLIKYSQCSTVSIIAEYSNRLLKIEVADDGKGFDTTIGSQGNGLLNMQKRAKALRGKLCIASAPGKGTRVSLAVQIE